MASDADIIMAGPNLRLDDLRWLVARCALYRGDSTVEIIARQGQAPLDIDYEKIIVHPRLSAGDDPQAG